MANIINKFRVTCLTHRITVAEVPSMDNANEQRRYHLSQSTEVGGKSIPNSQRCTVIITEINRGKEGNSSPGKEGSGGESGER